MKIKGHPVHMMIIHFPVALLPMDLCCSLLAIWTRTDHFIHAAYYALLSGVAVGWLAIITGTIDLVFWKSRNKQEKQVVIGKGLIHGALQLLVILTYTLFAFLEWSDYPYLEVNNSGEILTKVVLVGLLFAGNYFGGELVLKYWPRNIEKSGKPII